ncbi:thioredoxin family protein [Hyphomicrobium sp.]|uniref:thioredoxin family protein n=1 Tax=Hyphomicrobium sp. TaxID=82 RepID=UPI0025BA3744|nr:thioredoxin family protein [Hyphomicrobium sp.]MCC7252575.1 thioredoxin family protein [Hyphomicrobium sp.]
MIPKIARFASRPFTWCAVLALAALGLGMAAPHPSSARQPGMAELWNGAEIAWREIGPGIREATRTGKPVVMLFHASWCGSCRRYRTVWKDPGVVAASKSFVMILVDVDSDPGANGAFSPDGTYVPRTIFYTTEGEVMKDVAGKDPEYPHTIDLDDPAELRTLMQKAAGMAPAPPASSHPDRRAEN